MIAALLLEFFLLVCWFALARSYSNWVVRTGFVVATGLFLGQLGTTLIYLAWKYLP